MTDNMKKFFAYADAHEDTAKAIEALNREASEADAKAKLIALAAEAGFPLTDADFAPAEGELTDKQAEAASGGGWCESARNYSSGSTPVFKVGDCVWDFRSAMEHKGYITEVSTGKSGIFDKEFTYTCHWVKELGRYSVLTGSGWYDCNKTESSVYESQMRLCQL